MMRIFTKRSAPQKAQRPHGGPSKHAILKRPIVIKLNKNLLKAPLRFGLLHVRDGKDQVPEHGRLLNKEIYFKKPDSQGMSKAMVPYDRFLGFQFRCFVDYGNYPYQRVKEALKANGFYKIAKGEGKEYRAWFLFRKYGVCKTIDGITNNFFYPS